jgi:putative intracellular protease/amidase
MPKALLFLTSHDRLGETGRATGWYVPEAAHPWNEFTEAGWQVGFVSAHGGHPTMDGLDADDPVQSAFLATFGPKGPNTQVAANVDASDVDVVVYVGGHGAMWDFPDDTAIEAISREVWERGGIVSAVCHGPAGLVNLRLSDGTRLIEGRRVAAFTDDEEEAVGLTDVVPFLLASTLSANGAIHIPAPNWADHVIVDGHLITGQNPASAISVAKAIVAAVGAMT